MPLLPYDYLHLVNCPEVVTISDDYCKRYVSVWYGPSVIFSDVIASNYSRLCEICPAVFL